MTDRHTADTINDDDLDQLYRERDEARQSAAAIAAQRDRLRIRMNNLADRWEHALAPDKPYARALREEINCAPFDPDGAMAVKEYTERGQRLWAFRCWGTDACDGWLGLGHHTQTSALREQERHAAEAHAEVVAQPGYCPHCGRGDLAPTADEYEQQRQRADRAEAAITRLLDWADELDKTTRGIPPEATHPAAGHIRHRISYDPRKEN